MTCPNCIKEEKVPVNWKDFNFAIPTSVIIIGIFILLQKTGIVNLINSSKVSYSTAFMIGIIASV